MSQRVVHIPRAVLSSLDCESLAAAVNLRGRDDPGMRFARFGILGGDGKQEARMRARNALLGDDLRSFLTMPGLFFAFEWLLLQKRERNRVLRHDTSRRPERTAICALEREPEIYRAAIRFMPGLGKGGFIKCLDAIPGAAHTMMASHIVRYHQITFEKYAALGIRQDAAFLDFCGPLTAKRCAAIAEFWHRSGPRALVCNAMNGRYRAGWNGDRAHDELLRACAGSTVVDDFRYGQFRQVALRRIADEPAREAA